MKLLNLFLGKAVPMMVGKVTAATAATTLCGAVLLTAGNNDAAPQTTQSSMNNGAMNSKNISQDVNSNGVVDNAENIDANSPEGEGAIDETLTADNSTNEGNGPSLDRNSDINGQATVQHNDTTNHTTSDTTNNTTNHTTSDTTNNTTNNTTNHTTNYTANYTQGVVSNTEKAPSISQNNVNVGTTAPKAVQSPVKVAPPSPKTVQPPVKVAPQTKIGRYYIDSYLQNYVATELYDLEKINDNNLVLQLSLQEANGALAALKSTLDNHKSSNEITTDDYNYGIQTMKWYERRIKNIKAKFKN